MPDDADARAADAAAAEPRRALNLSTARAATNYANLAVVSTTPEEVVLNFGINVNPPNPEGDVNLEVTSRIILTYPSAKRLALTLGNVLQRYESRHGPIEVASGGQEPADRE